MRTLKSFASRSVIGASPGPVTEALMVSTARPLRNVSGARCCAVTTNVVAPIRTAAIGASGRTRMDTSGSGWRAQYTTGPRRATSSAPVIGAPLPPVDDVCSAVAGAIDLEAGRLHLRHVD